MQYPTIHMPGRTQTWSGGGEHSGWMAVTWALLAFVGGTMLGMMAGKKAMMSSSGGRGGGMPMWKHHHHGFGQPSCHMKHATTEPVAPGAVGESAHERNEGE